MDPHRNEAINAIDYSAPIQSTLGDDHNEKRWWRMRRRKANPTTRRRGKNNNKRLGHGTLAGGGSEHGTDT